MAPGTATAPRWYGSVTSAQGDLRLYQVSEPEGYHDTMPLDAAGAASFTSNFFKLEASAGRVYSLNFGSAHPELGLVRLYRCVNDGAPRPRVFAFYLSRDVNCEGVQRGENSSISTRGTESVYVWPTQRPGTHAIYRCHRPEAWDWIATSRKDCEGRPGYVNQLILGYAY